MYNMFKTFMFLAALTALFLFVGGALGGRTGMTVALVMAGAMNFFAYWYSDKLALKMSGAREVSETETPQLHSIVAGLAQKAGIPKPRVYLIAQQTPNAFATGRNPDHAAVAVTEGILRILNREELISYIATMAQWAMLFGGFGGSDDDEGGAGGLIGGLIMMIIAPIAAALIQMAISRSREYQADATGAKICNHPMALASALKKLDEGNHRVPMKVNPATAQMYIVNPLTAASVAKLFSTHPPIQERIRRLRSMAGRQEGV
ncbi:MAG: zinc metalloprotease HtpX [Deltaproteobacteria bacterium]|nr:zinc metalloprotease HtpX [Deltaproteobacteria bacterium]